MKLPCTRPHKPTAEELGAVALLCTKAEWERLVGTPELQAAAEDSLERVERVASKFLGRTIATGLTQPSIDSSL